MVRMQTTPDPRYGIALTVGPGWDDSQQGHVVSQIVRVELFVDVHVFRRDGLGALAFLGAGAVDATGRQHNVGPPTQNYVSIPTTSIV